MIATQTERESKPNWQGTQLSSLSAATNEQEVMQLTINLLQDMGVIVEKISLNDGRGEQSLYGNNVSLKNKKIRKEVNEQVVGCMVRMRATIMNEAEDYDIERVRAVLRVASLTIEVLTRKARQTTKETKAEVKTLTLKEKVELFAQYHHPVLIIGERGTGKTTLARTIHDSGPSAGKPFLELNCAAFQDSLIESELFGYEKGAFTGANTSKMGLLETANGGTLFLDEIGDMPLSLQTKLLKAVEEQKFHRLGATKEKTVNVRIIAATSKNLRAMVEDQSFRADLYDRLAVLQLRTAPLSERQDEIPEFITKQLQKESKKIGGTPFKIQPEAVRAIQSMSWPGNIRELNNFISKCVVLMSTERVITIDTIRIQDEEDRNIENLKVSKVGDTQINAVNLLPILPIERNETLHEYLDRVSLILIRDALAKHNNNISATARELGLERTSLKAKLRSLKKKFSEETIFARV